MAVNPQLILNKTFLDDIVDFAPGLPDEFYHTIVTSPPYFNVRDYKVKPRLWPEYTFSIFGCPIRVDEWHGCYGLEPTLEMYVAHTVYIFELLKPKLRSDGTCWVNIGDTYCSTAPGSARASLKSGGIFGRITEETQNARAVGRIKTPQGMKPKDMMGVPWMVAFALRDAGW